MDFLVAVCAGAVTLIALIFGTPLAAQTPAKRANSAVVKSIPRAADGHPNLEGNWSYCSTRASGAASGVRR
jgi:hypothetical protein